MEAALINSEEPAVFVPNVKIKARGNWKGCGDAHGSIDIEVRILPGEKIFGFYVDGNKDIHPAKNLAKAGSGEKLYNMIVPIKDGKTFYGSNHIRLLIIDGSFFYIYEVAIIFQNGRGGINVQRVYEGICYQYSRTIVACPEFSKWPQLIEYLTELHREIGTLNLLDDIADYVPDPLPKNPPGSDLPDGFGRVDWYNVAKGEGGLLLNNGMAYVHWSDIVDAGDGLKKLLPGQEVAIARLIPRIPSDKKHTFAYKAEGVEVV